MSEIEVQVRVKPGCEDLGLPRYHSQLAAGCDLISALESELDLAPGARAAIPTGLFLAIPAGYEGQVRPRSGLAARHGVTLANSPGTIDADYRGEVTIILINLGHEPLTLRRGDRIAQLVIAPVSRARFEAVAELPASGRGAGGFGSTGR